MEQTKQFEQTVEKLSQEHYHIFEQLEKFDLKLKNHKLSTMFKDFQSTFIFLKKDLIDHFLFEEQHLFQKMLLLFRSDKLIKSILEIQKEHGIILTKIETLEKLYFSSETLADPDSSLSLDTAVYLKKLMEDIKLHAKKEVDEIYFFVES